jgi:hypothetical protein
MADCQKCQNCQKSPKLFESPFRNGTLFQMHVPSLRDSY